MPTRATQPPQALTHQRVREEDLPKLGHPPLRHPGENVQAYSATATHQGVPRESLRHDRARPPQHASPATDGAVQRGSPRVRLQTATHAVSPRRRGGAVHLELCRAGRARRCDHDLRSLARVYRSRSCWAGSMGHAQQWRATRGRAQTQVAQRGDCSAPPVHSPPRSGSASVSPTQRAAQGSLCSHQ
jgi:hypothetical protein